MVVKQDFSVLYFDGGSKTSFCCMLRDCWKFWETISVRQKSLKNISWSTSCYLLKFTSAGAYNQQKTYSACVLTSPVARYVRPLRTKICWSDTNAGLSKIIIIKLFSLSSLICFLCYKGQKNDLSLEPGILGQKFSFKTFFTVFYEQKWHQQYNCISLDINAHLLNHIKEVITRSKLFSIARTGLKNWPYYDKWILHIQQLQNTDSQTRVIIIVSHNLSQVFE